MERRIALCEELETKELATRVELLKGYFQEKKIAVVVKTGNLTFQTEVATVLVNNAKFTQAKGKTRSEAEERALRKAWEKTLTRAKDCDFAWLQRHLQSHPPPPRPKLRPTPALNLSLSQSSPIHTSEPVSPLIHAERQSRSSHSGRYTTEKLDDLISKAAETAKASSSPAPRRRLSARSRGIPSFSSDDSIGSSFKEKLSPKRSLMMPEAGDSLQSVLEEADLMKRIRRLEYTSLQQARFERKTKRAKSSLAGTQVY